MQVIFANGNKYEADKIEWSDYWKHYYVTGRKWIKTKKRYSSNTLVHSIGTTYEPVTE